MIILLNGHAVHLLWSNCAHGEDSIPIKFIIDLLLIAVVISLLSATLGKAGMSSAAVRLSLLAVLTVGVVELVCALPNLRWEIRIIVIVHSIVQTTVLLVVILRGLRAIPISASRESDLCVVTVTYVVKALIRYRMPSAPSLMQSAVEGFFMNAFISAGQAWFLKVCGVQSFVSQNRTGTPASWMLRILICMTALYMLIGAVLAFCSTF